MYVLIAKHQANLRVEVSALSGGVLFGGSTQAGMMCARVRVCVRLRVFKWRGRRVSWAVSQYFWIPPDTSRPLIR